MSLTTEEITIVSGQALPTPPKKETPAVLSGFVDFWQGLKRHELWLNLAWEDLIQSFYRTKLGLLWVPLAFLLRVSIFVVIFRQLVDSESADRVVLYITIGFLIWEVLITGLTDGLSLFTSNGNWIQASSMPFSIFSFQQTTTNLFRFSLHAVVVAGALYLFRNGISDQFDLTHVAFMALAFIAIVVNITWVQIFFGIVCARFRDVQHLIGSLIRVLFFLTPVIWRPVQIGDFADLIHQLNPFTHYIEIVRTPLLDGHFPTTSWIVVGVFTVVGHLSAWILLGLTKKKVAFWI